MLNKTLKTVHVFSAGAFQITSTLTYTTNYRSKYNTITAIDNLLHATSIAIA